jgi:hypothetical protein
MTDTNILKDESSDKDYFTITPRLVWALARDPYDLALWIVVKDVAGEKKQCTLSTPQLAALAMMSEGKASQCRKYLIDQGLLYGEVKRDPGYPQPVWHLTVPNLWAKSLRWSESHLTIQARIDFKQDLMDSLQKESSSHEGSKEPSPHEGGTSPHEEGTSPGEEGTSPHETKNIHKKNQKEEPEESGPNSKISGLQKTTFGYLQQLKGQLAREMSKADYGTWVKDTVAVGWDGDVFQIGCGNAYGADWCESRLGSTCNRMLSGMVERSVTVRFMTCDEVPA